MCVSWNNNSPLPPSILSLLPHPHAPWLSLFSPSPPPPASSMLVSGRCCVIRECVPAEALFTKAHSEWTMSLGENAGYCEGLKWGDPTTPLHSSPSARHRGSPTPSTRPTSSPSVIFLRSLLSLCMDCKIIVFLLLNFSFHSLSSSTNLDSFPKKINTSFSHPLPPPPNIFYTHTQQHTLSLPPSLSLALFPPSASPSFHPRPISPHLSPSSCGRG